MCALNKSCVVVFLTVTNVYLVLMGIGSIAVGCVINVLATDKTTYLVYMSRFPQTKTATVEDSISKPSLFEKAGLIFLVTGILLILLAFFGILVGFFKRKRLVIVYMILLFPVFICEIAICSMGFLYIRNLDGGLDLYFSYTIRKMYSHTPIDVQLDLSQDLDLLSKVKAVDLSSMFAGAAPNNGTGQSTFRYIPTIPIILDIFSKRSGDVQSTIQQKFSNPPHLTDEDKISIAWDRVMVWLQCCGNKDYADFFNTGERWQRELYFSIMQPEKIYPYGFTLQVPPTCCKVNKNIFPTITFDNLQVCLINGTDPAANHEPCYFRVRDTIKRLVYALAFLSLTLMIVEVFGFFNGLLAWCALYADEQDAKYRIYGTAEVSEQPRTVPDNTEFDMSTMSAKNFNRNAAIFDRFENREHTGLQYPVE